MSTTEGLILRDDDALYSMDRLAITPVMDLALAKQRLYEFQQFVKEYLVEGEDFGTIPGVEKPSLFKPGADKLCELYGLADEYEVVQRTEDWERGLFDYEVKCRLTSKRSGALVSTGMGSCNSYEGKYRWRAASRKCPQCGKETIIKGREEYGGGWICFGKKGGCGAKWPDGAKAIESQTVGRIQNEDIADVKNTILKMAKKRAKIDATLAATRSSGIFTQDVEDMNLTPPEEPPQTQPQPTTQKNGVPTCQLCSKAVVGMTVPKNGGGREQIAPERIIEAGKRLYNGSIVCGQCQIDIKNKKRQPPATQQSAANPDSFNETKYEKDESGGVIATGLVRSCSLTEGPKPRLIVRFDDNGEVCSFHTKSTKALIEKHCLNKTCSFLCEDSQFGLRFSTVLTIDGIDASTVQLNSDIVP
jgi:hypothetical protein